MGLIVLIVGIGLSLWAQYRVKSNFKRWSKVNARAGLTGAEVARKILDINGLQNVKVESIEGSLSDHYDPTSRTVRLSEPVYGETSISAISVAAHECGHAIQHKEAYGALVLRHRMIPVLNIASGAAPFLLLAGVFFKMMGLLLMGIVFFSVAVLFHIVTLPVEFNASTRAKEILYREGMVSSSEETGVRKVLGAAAFTYVASALVALMELLHYILIYVTNDD